MEYIIHIEDTGGKKKFLNPEGAEGFYLYPGDIRKMKLKDGDILAEEDIISIRQNMVIPRAKKRALGILSKRDCTEAQMREKLEKSFYDEESIQEAISFLQSYGYLDDLSYAREYIYYKRKKKSLRQIQYDLRNKGISMDVISLALDQEGGHQEKEEVAAQFEKYCKKYSKEDPKAKQKIYMHFVRKGYACDIISDLMEEWLHS